MITISIAMISVVHW